MKKVSLSLIIMAFVLFAFESSAQKKGMGRGRGKSKGITEGTILIDGYYGYGDLYNAVFKALSSDGAGKFSSIGPVGFRGEYLLSDKIGIGIDVAFSQAKIVSTYQDLDSTGKMATYTDNLKTSKIGGMVTFNYHFINNKKFDAFFVTGVGYGNRSTSFSSNYLGVVTPTINSVLPVAARVGVGFRYFFTDNLGLQLGLGIGQGGMTNAGLTYKIN